MGKVIIHLINSNSYSGLENVVCDIIQNTSDEIEHIYVTQEGQIVEVLEEKKIKYEIIKKMSIKELKRVIKKYNVNIIHAHDFTASCIASMSFTKLPIISHLHHNAPWLKKINLKTILYLLCSWRIKKILIVSQSVKNEYVFSKFIKNKFECIGNPISVNKIINMVEEKDYEKKYDICCVGRLTDAKDPIRWLNIVNEIKKEIPNIKCVWVGDGELKDEFVEKINELGLIDNIEMPGFQKNPYKYLASSKIYLQTSAWEGFGLSAFEALSLGVPAVVSNVGGLPGIVDNTCGALCVTDQDFEIAIYNYLVEVKKYNKISKNAVLKAEKLDNFKEYLELLKKNY